MADTEKGDSITLDEAVEAALAIHHDEWIERHAEAFVRSPEQAEVLWKGALPIIRGGVEYDIGLLYKAGFSIVKNGSVTS